MRDFLRIFSYEDGTLILDNDANLTVNKELDVSQFIKLTKIKDPGSELDQVFSVIKFINFYKNNISKENITKEKLINYFGGLTNFKNNHYLNMVESNFNKKCINGIIHETLDSVLREKKSVELLDIDVMVYILDTILKGWYFGYGKSGLREI